MVIIGSILIVLALLIVIVPQFTSCQSQGKEITLQNGKTIPMKCYWTGQSEILLGTILLLTGIMLIFVKRRETRIALSIIGVALGIATILIPAYVIGVCATLMICNTVMKPVLISAGIVVTLVSLIGLFITVKAKEEN